MQNNLEATCGRAKKVMRSLVVELETTSGGRQGRIAYGYNQVIINESQMIFEQETKSHWQI